MSRPRAAASFRIDPFDLRLFSVVVEEGSITAGAHRIHLSLAAASARLQQLEHAIGAPLLLRAKRGVTPTDAGRTLLHHAGRLQREFESLHAEMAAHAHGVRSTVRVACNTAAMSEYLPVRLGRFLVEHPEIDVDLRELDSQDVLLALRRQHADIGIVADHVATQGLATRRFTEDRLVALMPAAADDGEPGPLGFVDLLERPFVGLPAESGLSRFLQAHALQHGRGLHHRVRVRSFEAVVQLVAEGVGVAVLPQAAVRRLVGARVSAVERLLSDPWATRHLLLCATTPEALGQEQMGAGAAALWRFLAPGAGTGTWPDPVAPAAA